MGTGLSMAFYLSVLGGWEHEKNNNHLCEKAEKRFL